MHHGVTYNLIPNFVCTQQRYHFIEGSMNKQMRICSIMKASVRGGSRLPRFLHTSLWLWSMSFGVEGSSNTNDIEGKPFDHTSHTTIKVQRISESFETKYKK